MTNVQFSHDGQLLAVVGFENSLRLYRTATGQLWRSLKCPCGDMRAIAFSPDDRWLAGGGRNGRIRIWDLDQNEVLRTFVGHSQRIRALTFDDTGQRLISASEDRTVRVWDASTGQQEFQLAGVPGKVLSMTALPHGRLATACSDNAIRIWDVSQRRLISQLLGHTGSVAALDANQNLLVSGSFDTTVRLWPLPEMDRAIAVLERQRTRPVSRTPSAAISTDEAEP